MLICGCAGIGRLASLRCWCLQWAYGFESRHPHQSERLLLQSLFFLCPASVLPPPLLGEAAKSQILLYFPVSFFKIGILAGGAGSRPAAACCLGISAAIRLLPSRSAPRPACALWRPSPASAPARPPASESGSALRAGEPRRALRAPPSAERSACRAATADAEAVYSLYVAFPSSLVVIMPQ